MFFKLDKLMSNLVLMNFNLINLKLVVLLVPFGAFWCLLVPFGAFWCFLVPFGAL